MNPPSQRQRLGRALYSALLIPAAPLGVWRFKRLKELRGEERLKDGLIVVLPGIEGKSTINVSIVRGLADGELPHAIEIYDWTTGFSPLFAYHLRSARRQRAQAELIADRIRRYRAEYPGRPVHLIGHSGGAGVALEALGGVAQIDSAMLLSPAVSPQYELNAALRGVKRGIWNFHSRLDVFFLGVCTIVLGTQDGRHCMAAGVRGFQRADNGDEEIRRRFDCLLHQTPFQAQMVKSGCYGGHNGFTNRLFVAEWLAPMLAGESPAPVCAD